MKLCIICLYSASKRLFFIFAGVIRIHTGPTTHRKDGNKQYFTYPNLSTAETNPFYLRKTTDKRQVNCTVLG